MDSNNRDIIREDVVKETGSSFRMWAAMVACTLTLVSVSFQLFFFDRVNYTKGFAPLGVTAFTTVSGVIVVLMMIGWCRQQPLPRVMVLILAWGSCLLLIWSSAGIVFDVLRTAAVLGIPGLPPIVDWIGFGTRAISLIAAIFLASSTVHFQRVSLDPSFSVDHVPSKIRSNKRLGYTAFVLSFPYPLLKIYWSLGGDLGGGQRFGHHAAYGEIVVFGACALLSLSLVQKWGQIFPRWVLITGGWTAACLTAPMGLLALFGSLMQLFGLEGPVPLDGSAWIVAVVYIGWLFLGLSIGGATWIYQKRTQAGMTQKRKHS